MEELILRYCLALFSVLILTYLYYFICVKNFINSDYILVIKKGESISKTANNFSKKNNHFENKIIKYIFIFQDIYKPINYGKFELKKNINLLNILKIISNKSNLDYKVSIIEGWEKYHSIEYLYNFYDNSDFIEYDQLLADTYLINSSNSFNQFKKYTSNLLDNFFSRYKDNEILKKYGRKNILIISSLVEKEAKNEIEKKLIASVIFNRLDINMKLQIDATVIFSKTNGEKKNKESLIYDDLKIKHPYNTYFIKGLPPGMICYVGRNTVKSVLEYIKSDYLFYFYNILEEKHIFSKNFEDHKNRLYEYRKKNKIKLSSYHPLQAQVKLLFANIY